MKKSTIAICLIATLIGVLSGCTTTKSTADIKSLVSDISVVANARYTGEYNKAQSIMGNIMEEGLYNSISSEMKEQDSVIDITEEVLELKEDPENYIDGHIVEKEGRYYIDASKLNYINGETVIVLGDSLQKLNESDYNKQSTKGNEDYRIDIVSYSYYDDGKLKINIQTGYNEPLTYEEFIESKPELKEDLYGGEGEYAVYTTQFRGAINKTYELKINNKGKIQSVSNNDLFIGEITE